MLLALYGPSLRTPFFYDDHTIVVLRTKARAATPLTRYFGPSYWSESHPGARGLYRPLREVVYSLLARLGDTSPFAHHLASLACQALAVVGLYLLAVNVGASAAAASLAALLFAAHPLATEAVLWAKSLADPLCAGLCLLSAAAWAAAMRPAGGARGHLLAGLSVLLFGLALLTKEVAVGLVPVCVLLALGSPAFRRDAGTRRPTGRASRGRVAWTACFALLALLYLTLHYSRLGLGEGLSARYRFPVGARLALGARTASFYLRMALFPTPLTVEHSFGAPMARLNAGLAVACAFLALATAAGAWLWRRGGAARLGALWTAAFLLPLCNLVPYHGRGVGESRADSALAGACLCMAWAFYPGPRRRKGKRTGSVGLVAGALVILFSALTVSRVAQWRDTPRLWRVTLRTSPHSAEAHGSLARIYHGAGHPRLAETFLRRAVSVAPPHEKPVHLEHLLEFLRTRKQAQPPRRQPGHRRGGDGPTSEHDPGGE